MKINVDSLPYRPCVGLMLLNSKGEAFVGQRKDSDVPAWQMPQGGIDPGEDVITAGLRELEEETGVTSDLVSHVAQAPRPVRYELPEHLIGQLWDGRYRGQEQSWLLLRFHGHDEQVNIATKHAEFSEWRWMTPALMAEQIVPFKRAVYEDVIGQFAEYL